MKADVVMLPDWLRPGHCTDRSVVVFDVLRATTTMSAALSAGVSEIQIFPDIQSVAAAKCSAGLGLALTCGEVKCLRPEGFDLGNSPGVFNTNDHTGRVLLMSTTNGTRAIIAARSARKLYVGALVNATAVARELAKDGHDVTLLCAGTQGQLSIEDVLGAGAVLDALGRLSEVECESDAARVAVELFRGHRGNLRAVLADGQGGRNIRNAKLEEDIDFAAKLDSRDAVGRVLDGPLRVVLA
jgi:2-phosphosulfolactate phosphatase